jgi:DNA-binding LytR/AlgR family response regulator
MPDATAVIADDEQPSRAHLIARLAQAWPELAICGEAANGPEAVALVKRLSPDIAFLDIRMPGMTGLEVAACIGARCHVVFITAYDRYAVEAFENEALDYVLKPVLPERLAKTVARLRRRIAEKGDVVLVPDMVSRLTDLLEQRSPGRRYLKWIRAQTGSGVRLIPAEKVYFFSASNKYTEVMTRNREALIRKTLRELEQRLDPDLFFRIHRKTIVNAAFIERVDTSATGRGLLKLRHRPEIHTVSRRYTHLFRQM